MSFADNLKTIMNEKELTAQSISDAMGVSRGAVTHWSNGARTPSPQQIEFLAKILKVKVSQLFGDASKPTYRPLIGEASCGVPITYHYDNEYDMIPAPQNSGKNAYYIRADGDSMTPRINHGDLVLCDPDQRVQSGNIVHFEWDGQHGIKRYVEQGDIQMMVSLNQNYPPLLITDAYELRMAKCVQVMSSL